MGMLQSETARAGDVLQSKKESDVGVANGDAFEVVVISGHQVEQILAAVSIEDHFAIASAFNDDRLFGGAALSQIVSAVKRGAISGNGTIESAIHEAAVLIDARMNQDDVARLHAGRHGVGMIGLIGAHKIGGEQSSE